MAEKNNLTAVDAPAKFLSHLAEIRREMAGSCTSCGVCQQDCAFLKSYGTPGKLAASDDSDSAHSGFSSLPFACSLCRLCEAVCPAKLKPADMFLEMRREKMRRDPLDCHEHAGYLAYQKRGSSRLFSYFGLPENCDTVFFPGCTLAGTRSEQTIKIYEHLKKMMPNLGMVLDCCQKISHDLGREQDFQAMFQPMKDFLVQRGVKKVLVACPNCYRIFGAYGEGLAVSTIYEHLEQHPLPFAEKVQGVVTIHDPCPLRFAPEVHASIRSLVRKTGLTIVEMAHHGENALCCGEGGFVACLAPEFAENWVAIRKEEAAGRRIITYCAGCTNHLQGVTPTSHIVDLLWEPQATMKGTVKATKAPLTYWKRLKLKRHLKHTLNAPLTHARKIKLEKAQQLKIGRSLIILILLSAAAVMVHFTGATKYLEQETLRRWLQAYGALAPLIYMLVYALAPSLLLPGLPLTIVGGILFGPWWGVVYALTGATLGACLAFLIARYTARDWVRKQLRSPRWRNLDQRVASQGWKAVLLARLIPFFPFNLLNYAFGLTGIKFIPYAVATFFGMAPACIAFIVFSSALPDLLQGKLSPRFFAGLGLVILLFLLPLFYRRYKAGKANKE